MFHANDWPDFDAAAVHYLPVQESHWSSAISLRGGDVSLRRWKQEEVQPVTEFLLIPLQFIFHGSVEFINNRS
jgi:hypothetical protein